MHDSGTAILDRRERAGADPDRDTGTPSHLTASDGTRLVGILDDYLAALYALPEQEGKLVHLLLGPQTSLVEAITPTLADWLRTMSRWASYPSWPQSEIWDMITEGLTMVRTQVARVYGPHGPARLNTFATRSFLVGINAHWQASDYPAVHPDALTWVLRFLPDCWANSTISRRELAERMRKFDAELIARRFSVIFNKSVSTKHRTVKRQVKNRAAWRWRMLKATVAILHPSPVEQTRPVDRELLRVLLQALTDEERAAIVIKLGVDLNVSELTEARVRQDYNTERLAELVEDACDRIQEVILDQRSNLGHFQGSRISHN